MSPVENDRGEPGSMSPEEDNCGCASKMAPSRLTGGVASGTVESQAGQWSHSGELALQQNYETDLHQFTLTIPSSLRQSTPARPSNCHQHQQDQMERDRATEPPPTENHKTADTVARKDNHLPAIEEEEQWKQFGFVRFIRVNNPTEFLIKLQNIWIGSYKVRISIARYQQIPPLVDNMQDSLVGVMEDFQALMNIPNFREVQGCPDIDMRYLAWCKEAFTAIASSWGKVIIPEECASDNPNLAFGRVGILTTHPGLVSQTIVVTIDNQQYNITAIEDTIESTRLSPVVASNDRVASPK
ncbi:hypothetical protein LXL04_010009 [Taraxacum kok-saghyz]